MQRTTIKSRIGRDPHKGMVAFKTGTALSRKNRVSNRNDKYARREKRAQLRGE